MVDSHGELTAVRKEYRQCKLQERLSHYSRHVERCKWESRKEMEFKSISGKGNRTCNGVFMGQKTAMCEPNESLHPEK